MNTQTLNELANEGVKYAVIVKDETAFWREDVVKRAGKIETVYIVDLTKPTNLCELAVSYPNDELKNMVQNWESLPDDELNGIETNINFEGGYFNGDSVFNVVKKYNDERTYDEAIDNENENPSVC